MALLLMKIRFWNAPEVAPVLPLNRKYRRAQRYYRWLLPEPLPGVDMVDELATLVAPVVTHAMLDR